MSKIKFNLLDFLIIAVLILAAIFVGYRAVTGTLSLDNQDDLSIVYTIELMDKDPELVNKVEVGDTVTIGEKEKTSGEIIAITNSDAQKILENEVDNAYVWSTIPERKDIQITIKSKGVETETEVRAEATPIRIGDTMVVRGKGVASYGYIIACDLIKE